jgi:uncharacterized protein (TIGR01777 family)
MHILIAGASGFIGTELVKALEPHHTITILGRNIHEMQKHFSKNIIIQSWENLRQLNATNYNAVINLCGHNIATSRWSKHVKKELINSRVDTNNQLINWLSNQEATPHFICANAVGIYGLQTNGDPAQFDENSPIDMDHPRDFLSEIGIRWQKSLAPAMKQGIPVTTLRLGVVLQRNQGLLKKLAPSFWMGMGSVLGDGKQIISWVHIDDVIASILFLLSRPDLTGAFNVTSPNPVSQEQFARILAKTLHRPLLLKIPAKIIQVLLGEMGDCLLLRGQRVIPKRLIKEGYQFAYPQCSDALKQAFQ